MAKLNCFEEKEDAIGCEADLALIRAKFNLIKVREHEFVNWASPAASTLSHASKFSSVNLG